MMRALLALAALLAVSCSHTPGSMASGRVEVARSGPYSVEITDRWGRRLSTYRHAGRTWVLGRKGERYRIRVRNNSWRRIEAVISVDGRDAIDGRRANWRKPGYVIDPRDELVVDGFRVSMSSVATFRFSSVRDSYAVRMGGGRDVGVIGVAIFEERRRPARRPPAWWQRRPADEVAGGEAEAPRKAKAGASPTRSAAKGRAGPPRTMADRSHRRRPSTERPGLGTSFGERRGAPAVHVEFRRASPNRPSRVLSLRYDDADGLIAQGVDLRPWSRRRDERRRRYTARPFANQPRAFAAPPPGWRP